MRHEPVLDGIRAIAVLLVVASHAGFGEIVPGGFGVTIFFFLSGYLITSLLRSELNTSRGVDLKQFYKRRMTRILPPLYITMALVLVLIAYEALPFTVGPHAVWSDGLFLTNYAYLWTSQPGVPMPLWSLDVEEHFYLLFPILFVALHRNFGPAAVVVVIGAFCGLTLAIRLYNVFVLPDFSLNYYWTHTRIDSILFGACLAVWNNPADKGAWRPSQWHAVAAFAAVALTLVVGDPAFRESIRYSVQGAALFVIFSYQLHGQGLSRRVLSCWTLRWIGQISYTLYLCHMPILFATRKYAPALDLPYVAAIGTVLSLAYSVSMYFLVEKRLSRWSKGLQVKKLEAYSVSGDVRRF